MLLKVGTKFGQRQDKPKIKTDGNFATARIAAVHTPEFFAASPRMKMNVRQRAERVTKDRSQRLHCTAAVGRECDFALESVSGQ